MSPLARCAADFAAAPLPCPVGLPGTYRPGVHEPRQLGQLMLHASQLVQCCQRHGARAWEIGMEMERVEIPELLKLLRTGTLWFLSGKASQDLKPFRDMKFVVKR